MATGSEDVGGLRDSATDDLVARIVGWSYGNGHLSLSLSNGTYLSAQLDLDA